MSEVQIRLQALSDDYQKLNQEMQTIVVSRQKLDGQKQENLGVQKELDRIGDDETIYKMVGPVLLKQDKFEAENTVKGRLDFIANEITRIEDQIKETEVKIVKTRDEIIQVQTAAQNQAQAPAQ